MPLGPYLIHVHVCMYCRSSRTIRVISVSSPVTASTSPPPLPTCTPNKSFPSNNVNTPLATHLNTSQSAPFHSTTGTHTILV